MEEDIPRYMHWNEYIKMLHTHLSIQIKHQEGSAHEFKLF